MPESAETELIRAVLKNQKSKANWEIKASVRINLDEEKYNGILTCRINDVGEMWVSFKAGIGIEMFRAYADRDSVWVQSKFLKFEEKENWEGIRELIGFPLDFGFLKASLTRTLEIERFGERWTELSNWKVREIDGSKWMESAMGDHAQENTYFARYKVEVPGPVIREMVFEDIHHMWTVSILYDGDDNKAIDRVGMKVMDHNYNVEAQLKYISIEEKVNLDMPFEKF